MSTQGGEGRINLTISKEEADRSAMTIFVDNTPLVTIGRDGALTYGPNYTPDAAAKLFWDAIVTLCPWRDERAALRRLAAALKSAVLSGERWAPTLQTMWDETMGPGS